jgi:hypothetical protein
MHLTEMRDLFFVVAWRDAGYVRTWFERLKKEPYLFPDAEEYQRLVKLGEELAGAGNVEALRDAVKSLLSSRIALAASDSASELASIVRV